MVGRVRRSRYEKAEALNTQQATRDLQALTKAGLLTTVGKAKGRHSVAGPRFPRNVLETAQQTSHHRQPVHRVARTAPGTGPAK